MFVSSRTQSTVPLLYDHTLAFKLTHNNNTTQWFLMLLNVTVLIVLT